MRQLFTATNTFVEVQTAAAREISSATGQPFDDLLNSVLRSARHQGFAAVTLIGDDVRGYHLQWVGADAYSIHGTWYLAKNLRSRDEAIARAYEWYRSRPDLCTVYDGCGVAA